MIRARAMALTLVATLVVGLVAGCSGAGFDPSGPCTTDGRAAGAYPALEALVPATFRGRPPDGSTREEKLRSPEALATLRSNTTNS